MKKFTVILTITIVGQILLSSCASDQKKLESVAEVSTEESLETAESEEKADVYTAGLPKHLEQCTPYSETFKHPFTGEELNREVVGIDGERSCEYKEEMPNGGLMTCKYSEQTRKVMAKYYSDVLSEPGSMGFNAGMYTIEGNKVTNPLDEVMKEGMCTISGY